MTTREFPIVHDESIKSIPWDVLKPHEAQALVNHKYPLEKLASMGGLSPEEALAIIEGRPWERMAFSEARRRLLDYVDGANREPEPPPPEPAAVTAINDALRMIENMRSGITPPSRHAFNKIAVTLERARGLV